MAATYGQLIRSGRVIDDTGTTTPCVADVGVIGNCVEEVGTVTGGDAEAIGARGKPVISGCAGLHISDNALAA